MQLLLAHKGYVLSFILFMLFFGFSGLWWAGFFCWAHFAIFVMPKSWR